MNKRKIIIDCDPGIDDSLAIMLALTSPEIEVLGSPLSAEIPPWKWDSKTQKRS